MIEFDIRNWLLSENNTLEILNNQRFYTGRNFHELDLYLPDYNLGIEYHGLYWHADINKGKNYHKEKYEYFKYKNIDVIQIFESDWVHKQSIIKSIIRSKMGLIKNKIFARKCIIKEIPNSIYKQFCELNHVQGYGIAKVKLGLYYNDTLVQIMSFSKSRFNKHVDWENIRTCSLLNTIVVGGFSKLFLYFRNNIL